MFSRAHCNLVKAPGKDPGGLIEVDSGESLVAAPSAARSSKKAPCRGL